MAKFLKIPLLLAAFVAVLSVSTAYASHDPDTITIISTRSYSDISTTGDILYVVRYRLLYTVLPTEPVNETWIGRINDAGGAGVLSVVNLSSNNPIPDLGYSDGIFSFYFSTEPTPTGTLNFELYPNPTAAHPSATSVVSNSVEARTDLAADIRGLAITLESVWSQDIISFSTGSGKFTTAGADYFSATIPNLNSYAPDLFILGNIEVDPETFVDDVDTTYRDNLRLFWDATPLGNFLNVASSGLNIDRQMLELVLICAFLFTIGGWIYAQWRQPEPALLVCSMGFVVFSVVGLGYMEATYALAAISAIVFFFMLFFKPSGA